MAMKKSQTKRNTRKVNAGPMPPPEPQKIYTQGEYNASGQINYEAGFKAAMRAASAAHREVALYWRSNGRVEPGLYLVESYEGKMVAATFYEVNYGERDSRNEANFVSFDGEVLKPHCISRFIGPVDTSMSNQLAPDGAQER